MIIIIVGALGSIIKGLLKGTGLLRNQMMGGDSIIAIGQNTEVSPEDLRRVAVTQTPMSNHRLTLM